MTENLFVDRYRIIRQIGSGGMGVVYEAEDELLKKTVAIKTIRKGILNSEHIQRFQREAQALAALNHPNLVPVYIFGITDDNEPYIVMRLEQGQPLEQLIEGRGYLALYKSLSIFINVADAMQHAHRSGVLHRDLKPSNILVRNFESANPEVVVIDFGIAMIETCDAVDSLTKTGMLVGTPAYMSPEQVRGKDADARSDVYSLGCIMFETLTGRKPFEASSALEVLGLKTTTQAPDIDEIDSKQQFPVGIVEIVAKALSMFPEDRQQTMEELKLELTALKTGDYRSTSSKAKTNDQAAATNSNAPFGKVQIAAIVGLVASIGILAAGFVYYVNLHEAPVHVAPPELRPFKDNVEKIAGVCVVPMDADDKKAKACLENAAKLDPKLHKVALAATYCTGTFLENCTLPIDEVVASSSLISDKGFLAISKLPRLKTLLLQSIFPISDGLAYVGKAPALSKVEINDCSLNPQVLNVLASSKTLKELSLTKVTIRSVINDKHRLSDPALKAIASGGSPSLEELEWRNMHAHKDGLKSLSALSGLRVLKLRGLDLQNSSLVGLGELNLRELDLRDNERLDINGLKLLAGMKTISVLKLDSKNFNLKQIKKEVPNLAQEVNLNWEKR